MKQQFELVYAEMQPASTEQHPFQIESLPFLSVLFFQF